MASAWGLSWGSAWGNAWGAITSALQQRAGLQPLVAKKTAKQLKLFYFELDDYQFEEAKQENRKLIQDLEARLAYLNETLDRALASAYKDVSEKIRVFRERLAYEKTKQKVIAYVEKRRIQKETDMAFILASIMDEYYE